MKAQSTQDALGVVPVFVTHFCGNSGYTKSEHRRSKAHNCTFKATLEAEAELTLAPIRR